VAQKGWAFLSLELSGSFVGDPRNYSFSPGVPVTVKPVTVDISKFRPGEILRLAVYPAADAYVTPEPGALVLLLSGLVALRRMR